MGTLNVLRHVMFFCKTELLSLLHINLFEKNLECRNRQAAWCSRWGRFSIISVRQVPFKLAWRLILQGLGARALAAPHTPDFCFPSRGPGIFMNSWCIFHEWDGNPQAGTEESGSFLISPRLPVRLCKAHPSAWAWPCPGALPRADRGETALLFLSGDGETASDRLGVLERGDSSQMSYVINLCEP